MYLPYISPIQAGGRAEIRGEVSELPLRLRTRAAGGGSQRTDADCVLVSFRCGEM